MGCAIHKEKRERARALRIAGWSLNEIAEALEMRAGNSTLTRWLADLRDPDARYRSRAKDELRAECVELRKQGLSYSQIAEKTGASAGSLSLWLHDVVVDGHAKTVLQDRANWGRRQGAEARKRRADDRDAELMQTARDQIGALTDRDILIAGVVAYWAEGSKAKPWAPSRRVTFINSDPTMILMFLRFLELTGVKRSDLQLRLQIHENADVEKALTYWADVTGCDPDTFSRTTLKRHKPKTTRYNVGDSYVGCLTIRVRRSSDLYRMVAGWYEGIVSSMGPGVMAARRLLVASGQGSNPWGPADSEGGREETAGLDE
jgi:transcriptional regulator with XRE-family HTH domain